jgi:hypothetical protein
MSSRPNESNALFDSRRSLVVFAIVAVGTVGGCHHAWQGIIALLVAAGFLFGAYRLIVHAADLFIGI